MPFFVSCPKCQYRYKLKDEVMGRKVQCKDCGMTFRAGPKKTNAPPVAQPAQPVVNPVIQDPVPSQPAPAQPIVAQPVAPPANPVTPVGNVPIPNPNAPLGAMPQPTMEPVMAQPVDPMDDGGAPVLASFADPNVAIPHMHGGHAHPIDPLQPAPMDPLAPIPGASQVPSHLGTPIHHVQQQSVVRRKKKKSVVHQKKQGMQVNMGQAGSALVGLLIMVLGIGGSIYSYNHASENGGSYFLYYGAIIGGFVQMIYGLANLSE